EGFSILDGNIIQSPDNLDPFVGGFNEIDKMWIEFNGSFYSVEKYQEISENSLSDIQIGSNVTSEEYSDVATNKYRIISDINLSGKESFINTKKILLSENYEILNSNGTPYQINNFENGDVNLIEI